MINHQHRRSRLWRRTCRLRPEGLPFAVILILLFFTPQVIYADTLGSAKLHYATGEKSQTDDIEERDLSGDFSFYKYGVRVKASPQKEFDYQIGFKDYKKNFDTSNNKLDNQTRIYDAGLSLPVYKTDKNSLGLNIDYLLRTKRYKNSPSLEYDQNNLSGELNLDFDKNYSLNLSGGIKDYDYIKNSPSNQLKTFLKIAPGIKNERLAVSGYYRKDFVDQSDSKKDYTEDSVSIRTTLNLNQLPSPLWGEGQGEGYRIPFLYRLGGHFGYGRNDTRESEEDREDSLRFEYKLWDITSYYRLNKSIDTQFTYGQAEREYFTSINSYDSWFVKDKAKLELLKKEPFNLKLLLGGEHKETKFYENESLSYNKNVLSGGFNVVKRAAWSFKPEFKFTKYDYDPHSTKNEKQYKLDLSFKKYLGSTDNVFEAGYRYKWKDYRYKKEIEQWSLNLSFEIKF